MNKINETIRTSLLSAALVFCGFSFAVAGPITTVKDDGAKQSLDALTKTYGAQIGTDLPIPMSREVAFDTQSDPIKGGGNNSGGNAGCTPSQVLIPGTDFSPKINDDVRAKAITDLLAKIAACKPLPYPHDGIVNTNSEGHMPQAPAGFYKEYTLMVPGRNTGDGPVPVNIGGTDYMTGPVLSARGPERIIIGGGKLIYYTMDHYATFVQLTIVK